MEHSAQLADQAAGPEKSAEEVVQETGLNLGFWKGIDRAAKEKNRPLFVLAPMADVTDCAFRKIINKYGKPDVTWTEFVSADGLIRATPEGKGKLMRDLLFNITDDAGIDSANSANASMNASVSEHPIVAQLFSSHPEYMMQAAKLVADLGFDGIDINMGCPDKGIEKQGCGSAMIKTPAKAQAVVRAAQEGAVRIDAAGNKVHIPITVKTRIGYNKNELETWLPALLEVEPAVITIHARTRKEMSKVPARWEHVARAVEIRDEYFAKKYGITIDELKADSVQNGGEGKYEKTLILGNGDVLSIQDGFEKCKATGADGAMLGRAIFGNPWLFRDLDAACKALNAGKDWVPYMPEIREKLEVMVEHTREYEKRLGDIKSFAIMKKHYKAYVNGFDNAAALRAELMEKATNSGEVAAIVDKFLKGL